jgi:hypothetical protein
MKVLKTILKTVVVFAIIYGLLTAGMFGLMLSSPDRFAGTMRYVPWVTMMILPFKPLWMFARRGHFDVGQMAPDFNLQNTDGNGEYRLSSSRGLRPVVLIFGSYT